MKIINYLKIASLAIFVITFSNFSEANSLPDPIYPTSKPVKKSLIQTYEYSIKEYTPPVKVKLYDSREDATYATPEEAAISQLSSMVHLDFEWFMDGWSTASKEYMEKVHFKAFDLTPEKRISAWKLRFKDVHFLLSRRIEYRQYVFIDVEIVSDSDAKDKSNHSIVLEKENGQWKATQKLRDHLLQIYWDEEGVFNEGLGFKFEIYNR